MDALTNYLAAEPLIIARLKDKVPEFAHVGDWSEYSTLEEGAIQTPAAFVMYGGDRVNEAGGKGNVQRADQIWGVVIVVRNVAQRRAGTAIREEAGPLMAQTLAALMGWQPAPQFRELERLPAPRPEYAKLVGFFPLQFAAGLILKGA